MRRVPRLPLSLPGICFAISCALVLPAWADIDEDRYTQVDAGGNPIAYAHDKPQQTDEQKAADAKEAQRKEDDKNWLLRDYEQRLRSANPQDDSSNNLYYQLSTNKELARLAGLPYLNNQSTSAENSANAATPPTPGSSSAPGDIMASTPKSGTSSTQGWRPLITPLGEPAAAGLSNFYGGAHFLRSGFSDGSSYKSTTVKPIKSTINPLDLSTPGMVSAGPKEPLADPNMSDPDANDASLSLLPGQRPDEARNQQDNTNLQLPNAKLQLPLPQNTEELRRVDAGKLNPSNRALPVDPSTIVNTKPIVPNDADEPMPASKLQPINPVRAPIANPYDLFRR
jgi:hypothetical protein